MDPRPTADAKAISQSVERAIATSRISMRRAPAAYDHRTAHHLSIYDDYD
jgi:hypothetical protein